MKLNYKTFGSGPPLIIMHGMFGMLDNWRTIARLLESKYKIILLDLRNHGRSPHADEMNYDVMSQDVLELINALMIDDTVLLGHSMGGKVAMQFALQHPDRVNKLIVVDISPRQYRRHHDAVLSAIESVEPDKLKDRSQAEIVLKGFLGEDTATIQFLLKNLYRLPQGGFAWRANMQVLIDSYDQLMEEIDSNSIFEKPTLFIKGELSGSIEDQDQEGITKLFPKARLLTVPNAGHWVHSDQPKALSEVIQGFIDA